MSNAMATQDESIHELVKRCQRIESLFESHKMDDIILGTEKRFDEKILVFKNSILDEIRKEIEVVSSNCVNRFTAINSSVADLKIETEKMVNDKLENRDFFKKDTTLKIQNLTHDMAKIDFTGIKESLEFETKVREEEKFDLDEQMRLMNENLKSLDIKSSERLPIPHNSTSLKYP